MHPRVMAVIAVVSLALTSCGEFGLEDLFEPIDLRASDDPAERAAGDVAEAQDKDRQAQETVREGLRAGDVEKLREAAELRPRDPRYAMYLAALEVSREDLDLFRAHGILQEGKGIVDANHPGASKDDRDRLTLEAWLEALDLVISVERERTPPDPGAIDRLERTYCGTRRAYEELWPSPLADSFFTFFAAVNCDAR